MRVYRGYPQRGAGLGNILGALFRAAKPILRSMLPVAARFGSRVLGDVADGGNVLRSARKHAPRAGVDALRTVVTGGRKRRKQRGSGLRQATVSKRRKTLRRRVVTTTSSSHIKASKKQARKNRNRRQARTKTDVFDQAI